MAAAATPALSGMESAMKMSREHALLGNYEASLVYFDGVIAQIQQHLRTVDDPHLRQQWLRAKEEITTEFSVVKDILRELGRFKEPPGQGLQPAEVEPLHSDRPLPRRAAAPPPPPPPAYEDRPVGGEPPDGHHYANGPVLVLSLIHI